MSFDDLIRKVPVKAGEGVEGTEFQALAVNIGLDEVSGKRVVIIALCDDDEEIGDEAAYFAVESHEQGEAIIECIRQAMEAAFHV